MGKVERMVSNVITNCSKGDKEQMVTIMEKWEEKRDHYQDIPLAERTRENDDAIQLLTSAIFELDNYILSGPTLGDIEEGCDGDTYNHFVDIPIEPEELVEPIHNYPRLRDSFAGEAFNRRAVLLHVRWGRVEGAPVIRVAITRTNGRDEEDEGLVHFDMPVEPVDGHMLKPKQYIFAALNEAKKRFSEEVGCVVCGKPEIWFKKVQTPKWPLYKVMWKEIDFADPGNRVCKECYKRVNPTVSDFDPHPEQDPETSVEEVLAAYNFNRLTGKEWYLPDKGEGLVSSVNETVQVHGHFRLDSPDYMAALDREMSVQQLGG